MKVRACEMSYSAVTLNNLYILHVTDTKACKLNLKQQLLENVAISCENVTSYFSSLCRTCVIEPGVARVFPLLLCDATVQSPKHLVSHIHQSHCCACKSFPAAYYF